MAPGRREPASGADQTQVRRRRRTHVDAPVPRRARTRALPRSGSGTRRGPHPPGTRPYRLRSISTATVRSGRPTGAQGFSRRTRTANRRSWRSSSSDATLSAAASISLKVR